MRRKNGEGERKAEEDCEQLSRHVEVSASTSVFMPFKGWEVVKPTEYISSANSLEGKKKKKASPEG